MAAKAEQAASNGSPELHLDLAGGKGWRPKDGDEVRGILRAIDKGWSDWGSNWYPILTIEQDDGKLVAIHCFHSVLLSRVKSLRPLPGEYVGVKYHGTEPTNDKKRTVALYSFDVSRPDGDSADPYAAFPDEPREPSDAEAVAA